MVTGASGFIGRAVCAELMRRGVDVLAVSRQPAVNIPGARMVFTRDYCDLERSPADVCIHLAGGNVVPDGPNGEQVFSDETAALTRSVLKKDFRRIVYASTALVYEDSDALPKCEADITAPVRPTAAQACSRKRFSWRRPCRCAHCQRLWTWYGNVQCAFTYPFPDKGRGRNPVTQWNTGA